MSSSDVSQHRRLRRTGVESRRRPRCPVLAVVGRPNVGKSTLVNRLIGRREAVVQDIPGVTRDRIAYDALWNGRRFTLVDTGGWEPDATGLQAAVTAQAEMAMRTADAILLVVDASVGATATDEAAARVLRRSDRPVLLAATKVDDDAAGGRHHRAVAAGAGGAAPGQRPARPRLRRSARRRAGGAAGEPAGHLRGAGRRPAPGRAGRQAERRQVQPAQPGVRRAALGRARGRRHHGGPGRLAGRAGRRDLALRRHRRACASGCARPAAWSTTPACAPRPRSRPPRW